MIERDDEDPAGSNVFRIGVAMTEERMSRLERALLGEPQQHLDLDTQLAPYVDGSIDPAGREIVESHLEDCAMCRGEAEDLRRVVKRRSVAAPALAIAASLVLTVLALLIWKAAEKPTSPIRPAPVPVAQRSQPSQAARAYENPEWTRMVDTALATGHLPVPDLRAIRPAGSTSRGGGAVQAVAMEPAGTVVSATRPRFRWPATAGAAYVVSVFAGDDEVAHSGRLRQAEWTPDRDLERGKDYIWQVEVTRGGSVTLLPPQPAPRAMFRVLDASDFETLSEARARHGSDWLLLAVLSARRGLVDDARADLDQLASSNDPRIRKLLAQARQEASPRRMNAAQ